MSNQSVIKAESNRGLMFKNFLRQISTRSHAEGSTEEHIETTSTTATPPKPPSGKEPPVINYEQLISQARKEEKDKLYPRLKKLEEENKDLVKSQNKLLLEKAALQEELDKKKNAGDSEEVTAFKSRITELEKEIETLKENSPSADDIRKQIESEYEVKNYLAEQLKSEGSNILSFLHSEITGNTKEEIDSSIQKAKEKTASVKKDLGLDDSNEGQKRKPVPPKQKKAPPAVPPEGTEEAFDVDYIRSLSPSSDEYKAFRQKMGLK